MHKASAGNNEGGNRRRNRSDEARWLASKMNPYDLYVLETALRLKEQYGGEISVITMGSSQSEAIIKEAYMMGTDNGYINRQKVCRL